MRRWLGKWRDLLGAVVDGVGRFPVAVAALAAFALQVNLVIAEAVSVTDVELFRAGVALVGGAAVATSAVLLGERWAINALPRHLLSLLLAGIVGTALWHWERLAVAYPVLFLAVVLTIPVAPYLGGHRDGFWAFVWRLAHALALAFIAVIVFCAGLSAILASIDYLFGISIESSVYGHVWSIGLGFVGPAFALSLIPPAFPERDTPDPADILVAGVRILSDFVAVPLIVAYVAVLHVYALKILFERDLPKGQIGWMVLSFGLAVLALRIVVHPMSGLARPPTQLFLRYWPLGLIVPLGLLVIAVWQRIDAYGVTPERYGLALFAFLLGAVLLAQLPRLLRRDIRLIPVLGVLALFAASFGPWGMFSVSTRSQLDRLMHDLSESGAVDKGALVGTPELSYRAAENVRSIVRMLDEIGQLDRLRPLFAGRPDDPFALTEGAVNQQRLKLTRIREVLNVEVLPPSPVGNFSIGGNSGGAAIGEYDLIVPGLVLGGEAATVVSIDDVALEVRTNGTTIDIASGESELRIAPNLLRRAFKERISTVETRPQDKRQPFLVELTHDGKRVAFLFERVSGNVTETALTLSGGSFDLFLRRSDWVGASGG
jgi:hypothetical protein